MSGLRDALQKLAREAGERKHGTEDVGHGSEFEPGCPRCWADEIGGLLAAHPEPDRHPSDAAVEAAAQQYWQAGVDANTGGSGSKRDWMRAALEAAYRVDVPRPLLDRDELGRVLIHFGADVRAEANEPAVMFGEVVDAVMKLARPMPTREQIELLLLAHIRDWHEDGSVTCKACGYVDDKPYGWPRHQADVVLALLNGTES